MLPVQSEENNTPAQGVRLRLSLPKTAGGIALSGKAVEHAGIAVQAAVIDRDGCGKHHKIENVGRRRDAEPGKDQHERAAFHADPAPGGNDHDYCQCADVKKQYALRHQPDGFGQGFSRISRLPGRDRHKLGAAKGKHDHHQGKQRARKPVRKKAALCPEIADGRGRPAPIDNDQRQPEDNHAYDRGHLDQRKPEFRSP